MQIRPDIVRRHDKYTAWRRDLHKHPEIGFEEFKTADFVAKCLTEFGIEVDRGMATTGIVGTLSNGPGPTIGLRADMDALPMVEKGDIAWRSQNEGRFHGCGHDGHTVILLAAAEELARSRNFKGKVHFIFQPAEEGLGGGRVMVEEGLFEKYPCDYIYALHTMPLLPLGTASVRAGPAMASFDEFCIKVEGKGGHAAMPHTLRDPAPAMAQIFAGLQTLVSREIDPLASAVLSVTQMHIGSTHNVIESEGTLSGTVRALDEASRQKLEQGISRIAKGISAAFDVKIDIDYMCGYPPLANDPAATDKAAEAIRYVLGEDGLNLEFPPLMAAEDFAFMLGQCPGSYILLGQGKSPDSPMVHNPFFDFDDELIPLGSSIFVDLVAGH